ncbi:hypothetical protein [Chryseobacterium sp. Leaf394]|uniref:hypothetical protein n=1 Tax=Chryseobacterium sp. Leaf394 TaxID=1736361 RepID=UPI0007013CD5|nr:hypothetical protein [Chryseobacterium sp. Leaf394]KQS93690.1 hypothetical protein ASG21_01565 [Chryseobacterium sp. Leaf394]
MVAFYIFFIAVFVFSISAVLLKKRKKKFLISGIVTVVLSPLIYFAFVFYLIFTMSREKSRDFDENEWKAATEAEGKYSKYEMMDDLISRRLLSDKDSIEVKRILGNPEFRDHENNFWQYYGGLSNGFGFVDHLLIVNFEDNKVSKLEHKRIKD